MICHAPHTAGEWGLCPLWQLVLEQGRSCGCRSLGSVLLLLASTATAACGLRVVSPPAGSIQAVTKRCTCERVRLALFWQFCPSHRGALVRLTRASLWHLLCKAAWSPRPKVISCGVQEVRNIRRAGSGLCIRSSPPWRPEASHCEAAQRNPAASQGPLCERPQRRGSPEEGQGLQGVPMTPSCMPVYPSPSLVNYDL